MKDNTLLLDKGSYVMADPGFIIKKNKEGTKFITKLWKIFYEKSREFQLIKINRIKIYITPTADEDSITNGIATDTGAIVIINLKYLKNHKIFKEKIHDKYTKILTFDKKTHMFVKDFNVEFKTIES
jgi:hypothetical protein